MSLWPVTAYAQYEAPPFDSIHLAVPEISQARDWYLRNIGGNAGETADRVAFGRWSGDHPLPLQLIFDISSSAKPTAGSVVDSIGFSYLDLDAKVRDLQAAGVKILSPPEKIGADWKHAFAEDPWGTRLELVEDPDNLGLHHVNLRVRDPNASLAWYVRAFGGDRASVYGREGIRYRDLGLFYVFATKDDTTTPSEGHSIDRLAWGPLDLDKVVNDLKTLGVKFSSDTNPRGYPACNFVNAPADEGSPSTTRETGIRRLFCTQPDQLPHRIVYLEAPDGVKVELVQHLEAGGH
ncbi:MAG TPA: VOC family protein [Vicinamibacterales bacterium]|nr:VOC family protein [Vicinamibacterales bacterium]